MIDWALPVVHIKKGDICVATYYSGLDAFPYLLVLKHKDDSHWSGIYDIHGRRYRSGSPQVEICNLAPINPIKSRTEYDYCMKTLDTLMTLGNEISRVNDIYLAELLKVIKTYETERGW